MAAQWIHRRAGTATLFRVIAPATSSGQLGKAARPSRGESRDVTAVWNTGGAIPQTPRHATASNTGQGGRMGLEESDSTEKEAVGNRSLHVNREQAASKKIEYNCGMSAEPSASLLQIVDIVPKFAEGESLSYGPGGQPQLFVD